MSKTDLVYCLLGANASKFSPPEKILLETMLLPRFYHALLEIFKWRYKEYLLITHPYQEETMYNLKFMQEMITDILLTEEYSLTGIATHTHIPEEVLSDVVTGVNTNPTFDLSRKIFELHIKVRRDLYDSIMRKIALEYLSLV